MRIDILTLFPESFEGFISSSIIKRAIEKNLVEINLINFRDYSLDPHSKVDDTPYGGGSGMVLMVEPLVLALEAIKTEDSLVILTTPRGKTYGQETAYELSKKKHLIIICGHYEGYDERIHNFIDLELSIGDFVLTGGEIPALAIMDSVCRLIPGVIDESSHLNDSFNNNLLDYPTYTKPRSFRGLDVPEVLLSGDHQKIADYRLSEQKRITEENRPDLLD